MLEKNLIPTSLVPESSLPNSPDDGHPCLTATLQQADDWSSRAVEHQKKGEIAESVACYQKALTFAPNNASLWSDLGAILTDENRKALATTADQAPAWSNLGKTPRDFRQIDGAVHCYRRAMELDPQRGKFRCGLAVALNARGIALRARGQLQLSVSCYREALSLMPHYAALWSNLGNALKDLKQIESAIFCHHRAIELDRQSPAFLFNLAVALAAGGRSLEAIKILDKALTFKPGDPHLRWDRALNELRLGGYRHGWVDYESRLETGMLPNRQLPGQVWKGQSYIGEKLILLSEQGFGDGLWCARYLAQVKAAGGILILECRKELIPLMAEMGIADEIIEKGASLPQAEWHCHICSLPGLYSTTLKAISGAPYLTVPIDRQNGICDVLSRSKTVLKVGIVWSGSTTFKGNGDRAVSLSRFVDAFAMPGVQLYSLQKGPPEAELKTYQDKVIDLAPHLKDFADTAVAIAELDLVIMTDSAVAHLSGALGKPVWVLINYISHWLWLTGRPDSPWYRSLRLFRAGTWDDWAGVFDAAAAELMRLVERADIACKS
jgi:tetratricopeptide (TPR) repeat protein